MVEEIYTFCLPDLGEGVVEGEVVEWLKQEGDLVRQDEPVVVVMTDKATVELPSPYPGKIQKQYYKPGEIAIKDKPLYDILLDSGNGLVAPEKKTKESKHRKKQFKEEVFSDVKAQNAKKIKAIPKVRHQANEWKIDLSLIPGSGFDGRITESDLHHTLAKQKEGFSHTLHLEGDEEQQLVGIPGLMAKRMDETHIPQFSYFEQADAVRLIQLRQNIKETAAEEGINVSYMPFFIRALSLTIKRYPKINASVDMQAGKMIFHKQHNIAIAMSSPQGLIVPVLKGVETLNMSEIIHAYESMKSKSLAGKTSSADMKEGTISISNFGAFGGEGLWATPMIVEPQVAILGVAKIRKVPLVKGEQVVVRDVVPFSWSFDHRLIDGELAAQVSHYYHDLIRDPGLFL